MGSTLSALQHADIIHSGEASRILEVSQSTVGRMAEEGRLRSIGRAGSYWLFLRADVEALKKARESR